MEDHPLQEMLQRTTVLGASADDLDDLFVRLVNAYWIWRYDLVKASAENGNT